MTNYFDSDYIIENLSEIVLCINNKYEILYANPASSDFLEFNDLVIGQTLTGKFKESVDEVLNTNKSVFYNHFKEGNYYNFTLYPDSNTDNIYAIGTDTTERKKIDFELQKISLITENIDNAVIITDNVGITEWVNRGFINMTGYDPDEAIGIKPGDLLQGADTDITTIDKIKSALDKHSSVEAEVLNYKKDGTPYWVSMSIQPIFDIGGKLTNFISIQSDISERKNIEITNKLAKERIHAIIENVLDGLITIDVKGMVIEWNTQAEKIFGWTRDEVINQNLSDLIIPKDYVSAHKAGMKNYLSTGEGPVLNKRIEIVGQRKDGTIIPIELAISPLRTENDITFSAFIRDISDRKKYEADLAEAKSLAENANIAKSQFLANMSHEIRTPMNAVFGITQLLQDTNLNYDQSILVNKLDSSAENLLGIINDVLDFSKIESGLLKLEKTSFNFPELIDRIINSLELKAEERSNDLNYHIDKKIPKVLLGDTLRIKQVLLNLVSNAIKFTENGEVNINCSYLPDDKAQPELEISVVDSGIGIAPENIDNIFSSFQQEDESTTRKFGGTGLGLAISKQLVELMGGRLSVTSTKGLGSNFRFTIPLEEGVEDDVQSTNKMVINTNILKGKKILYAEDNSFNQFIGQSIMQKWNLTIDIAENGKEAIELLKATDYDLVLMDLQMPVMGGIEATKIIRKSVNRKIPIIALTANVVKGTIEKCKDAGMNDYVAKPFEQEVLFKKIADTLGVEIELKESQEDMDYLEESEESKRKLYDLKSLEKFFENDKEQIHKMIRKFIEITPVYMEELNNFFENNDYYKTGRLAHKLKSSFNLIAKPNINKNIQVIEKYASTETRIEKLPQLIEKLNKDFRLLIDQLKSIV